MTSRHNPATKKGSASAGPWTPEERAAVIGLYWLIRAECVEAKPQRWTKAALQALAIDDSAPRDVQTNAAMMSLATHGYKPLPNMQAALRDDVRQGLVITMRLAREHAA